MKDDKLSIYLREFLIESKGRNAFIYEEMSKLVDMMKSYLIKNKKLTMGKKFSAGSSDILKNYLPFRLNVQKKIGFEFACNEFDTNGNLIKVDYYFGNETKPSVVDLKKPFDILGYYLNKKNMESYDKLFDICAYLDRSVLDYSIKVRKLILSTENIGDELGRDDVKELGSHADHLGIGYGKPYKYSWVEDYVDDDGQTKSTKRYNYKLPNRNKVSIRDIPM